MAEMTTPPSTQAEKLTLGYRLYSKLYAPLALMAFLVVWRGSIQRQIGWFAGAFKAMAGKRVLDVATGEGTLTSVGYKKAGRPHLEKLVCVDLSPEMIAQAPRRLKLDSPAEFVCADIMQPPEMPPFDGITCFGACNVFEDLPGAFKRMARLLKPGGTIWGSALLMPGDEWRRKKVAGYVAKGFMTRCPSEAEMRSVLEQAGLRLAESDRVGDVFFFAAVREE